jgi:hypothetical protein
MGPISSTLTGRSSLTPRFAKYYGITKEIELSSFETPVPGKETEIFLKTDSPGNPVTTTPKILLAAGRVESPAILMRSSLKNELQSPGSNALHLTDHDIFAKAVTFSYNDPAIREDQ